MAALDNVLNAATPVTTALGTAFGSVADIFNPPKPVVPKPETADRLADVIEAKDTVHDIEKSRRTPLWQRVLKNSLGGALIGATTIGAKAAPLFAHADNLRQGVVAGMGAGALLGGGTGAATELLSAATENRRLARAHRLLRATSPWLQSRLNDADVAEPAREFQATRSYPLRLGELGLVGGGVLGSIGGMYDPVPTTGDHHVEAFGVKGPLLSEMRGAGKWGLIGSGAGALAGALGGWLWRRHKRQQLVDALQKKTAQLKQAEVGPSGIDWAKKLKRLRARRTELDKTEWTTLESGRKVMLVSGEAVRNNIDTEFIGGGHSLVYDYVPENEIWIDTGIPESDRPFILIHEIYERALMERGWSYDAAHDAANELEAKVRGMEKTSASDPRKPDAPGEITWPATNGPSGPPPSRGWPMRSSNTSMIQSLNRQGLERYSMGRIVHDLIKKADDKLRSRAETVIYNDEGVVAQKFPDYLSFPGGGIDDGEEAEFAAIREAIEEADRKLLHIKAMGVEEMVWPEDQTLVDGYDGFRNYIFLALDGGNIGTTHEDNEDFQVIPFNEAEDILEALIERDDLSWAKKANEARLQVVREAADLAAAGRTEPVKLALAVPRQATDYFCGPACMAGMLTHFKMAADQTALAAELGTTADGTKTEAMLKVASDKGLLVHAHEGWTDEQLKTAAAADPVLLLIRVKEAGTGEIEDHFVVTTGADDEGITIADPNLAIGKIAYAKLADYWYSVDEPTKRWAAVMKTADAISVMPVNEFVHFNPAGQVFVAPEENRRFKLPRNGNGKPAAYEAPVRLIPPGGVPEEGKHGYDVRLHVGEGDPGELTGGEWKDPTEVLKNLYGSMGLKANAHFRDLDRARARVIVKAMRSRAKSLMPPQP